MALTQAQIINVCVSTFNAAPGAANLADLEAWVAANPEAGTVELAAQLGSLPDFAAQFEGMDTAAKAEAMAANFGLEAGTTGGDYAIEYFTTELEAGASADLLLGLANDFLLDSDAQTLADVGLTDAQTVLQNKAEVATYYSVEKAVSGDTIADLKAAVDGVDATAASVTAAKAEVDADILDGLVQTAAETQYALNTTDETAGTAAYIQLQLTATTAKEAALTAGATQAQINDALAVITTENAASQTLADIVALDAANTAVDDALAALASYDADEDGTVTVAEVDAGFDATLTNADGDGYNDLASTNITVAGSLVGENLVVPTAAEIADIHTANIAGLNATLTVQKAEEAVAQAEVDAIDGLEDAMDAVDTAEAAYEAAYAADVATGKTVTATEAAYEAIYGTVVDNGDGTVSDDSLVVVAEDTAGQVDAKAIFTVAFGDLVAGQSVTVGDTTITATEAMTAQEVAVAFEAAYSYTGFSVSNGATAGVVEYTADADGVWTVAGDFADAVTIGGTESLTKAVVDAYAADYAAQTDLSDATDALKAAIVEVVAIENDDPAIVAWSDVEAGILDITTDASDAVIDFADSTGGGDNAPLAADLITEKAETVAAEDAITDLQAAKAEFDAALADANVLLPLLEAQTEAEDDLVGEVNLADGVTTAGVASTQDVAFISDLGAGDAAIMTANALEANTDYIYVGTDYTVATDSSAGDDAVLEMFIEEGTTENDTLLTFETKAFGSSSAGDFFTVELIGVATGDLAIESGLISFA